EVLPTDFVGERHLEVRRGVTDDRVNGGGIQRAALAPDVIRVAAGRVTPDRRDRTGGDACRTAIAQRGERGVAGRVAARAIRASPAERGAEARTGDERRDRQ